MSPARPTRVSAPSTTCHPDDIESARYACQPAVLLPSNSSRQPWACSSAVSGLSAAGAAPVWTEPGWQPDASVMVTAHAGTVVGGVTFFSWTGAINAGGAELDACLVKGGGAPSVC